ncbi:hypothetical protein [Paracoccus sp. (in: a-proteobacteria)]|uniref:hypothetical protein n=1 Tax=Paracoccus sp. TaxID=267 RepID=UPI00396C8A56
MTCSFKTTLSLAALLVGLAAPLSAQVTPAGAPPAEERLSAAPACPEPATQAEPATQPDASEDGTAPENTGTTGWTGGTGGSQLGTNIQGAVENSPTWQPPTARGLDLKGTAEAVVSEAAC